MSNAYAESTWGLLPEPSQWGLPAWLNAPAEPATPRRGRVQMGGSRSAAAWRHVQSLVARRYAERGLRIVPQPSADPTLATLEAREDGAVVGTLSVRIDGPDGLSADATFPDELASLRRLGRPMCEFSRLAVECTTPSKTVLAKLFHLAHLYAHRLKGAELLVIEVHPRHAPFYRRGVNAQVVGEERLHAHVQAPAVLLCVDLRGVQMDINHMGGRMDLADKTRTLYPHGFSPSEEPKWLDRLSAQFMG
jgi:hypothetical protein